MRKMRLILSFMILVCMALTLSAQAIEQDDVPITWLPMEMNGQPCTYNSDLGWIRLLEWDAETQMYFNYVIDKATQEKVPGISYISEFSEELACVGSDNLDNPKYGFVDKSGEIAIPLEYDWVDDFSDGLALVAKKVSDNDMKYGFIDKEGRIAIPLQYDYAESFSEGLAVVGVGAVDDRKFGFVDLTGKIIIPLEYDGTARFQIEYNGTAGFENGVAVVYKVDDKGIQRFGIIDQANTEIAPLEYIAIDRGSGSLTDVVTSDVYLVCKGDRLDRLADGFLDFGVFNISVGSEVVASEEYDDISRFSDGMAVVVKQTGDWDWEYGYIDNMGKLVIPLQSCGSGGFGANSFSASGFSEGLALVGMLDDSGREVTSIIDKNGKLVAVLDDIWPNASANRYDSAPSFFEGLAAVSSIDLDGNRKYGYIDKTGVIKIPLEYDSATNFSDGLAQVSKLDDSGESKYGYIDKNGKVIIPIEYDSVGFLGNLGWVKKGLSYGIFENTRWEEQAEDEIPRNLPVWILLAASIIAVLTIVTVLKRKKKISTPASAAQTVGTPFNMPDSPPLQENVNSSGHQFCLYCGAELAPGTKFCTGCGKPVIAASSKKE